MLAVSVQPTPFRWTVKAVATGPRLTSSGNAVGVIQYVPVFFVDPVSIPQAVRTTQIVRDLQAEFATPGRFNHRRTAPVRAILAANRPEYRIRRLRCRMRI